VHGHPIPVVSEDDDEKWYVRERLRMKSATFVKSRFGSRIG